MTAQRAGSVQTRVGSKNGGSLVLEAAEITKTYRRGWRRRPLRVLTGAALSLRAGEIVGLVGENGSGKSSLMKILVGWLDRDGGTLVRRGTVGYCPQEPIDIGVAQNVMFSAAPPSWGSVLPGRGSVQVIVDAAFTSGFDGLGALMLAVAWLVGLLVVSAAQFRRIAEPRRA